jgi:hypothetical protein
MPVVVCVGRRESMDVCKRRVKGSALKNILEGSNCDLFAI